MKPGPLVAMLIVLLLGAWLVIQPTLRDRREGVSTMKLLVRARLVDQTPGVLEFQLSDSNAWVDEATLAKSIAIRARSSERGIGAIVKGAFNISSWWNLAWVFVGLLGQACFFGRMLIQWVSSERERKSIIPPLFWWLSFGGGILLFAYFVWRVDLVGVLGQSTGIVIYARNLRLIGKERRRAARKAREAGVTINQTPSAQPL